MPNLRPYRDYDEKDVINVYKFGGVIPVNKGTLVKPQGNGFVADSEPVEMIGAAGDFTVSNVVSQRYGVTPAVNVAGTADKPLGMLLFDVKETDENGELLKFRPWKAAEMEACISGQAVPIVTRGTFLYSGLVVTGNSLTAGADLYAWTDGAIATSGTNKVGKALGTADANGCVFVWLNCA